MKTKTTQTVLYIFMAMLFGIVLRLVWVYKFGSQPAFLHNGSLMLTTNDGYFFASGVQKLLYHLNMTNPRLFNMYDQGIMWVSAAIVAISPFSMENTLFYMPVIISSLIVIPIFLIGKLYDNWLWGFVAALVATIALSYYNRTMVGYYDNDMFGIWLPMLALYFMQKSIKEESWQMLLFSSLSLVAYSFLYSSSATVIYAISFIYIVYKLVYYRNEEFTYKAMVLLLIGILPFGEMSNPYHLPYGYLVQVALLFGVYKLFAVKHFSKKSLLIVAVTLLLIVLYFGNVFDIVIGKITGYAHINTTQGLQFFGVVQTVQEANPIDFITMANRISGSLFGFFIAIAGYVMLLKKDRAFILMLPLFAIGVFSMVGGLRFTIYATPVAALSSVYFVLFVAKSIKEEFAKKSFIVIASLVLIVPNIMHLLDYNMPTVFTSGEVQDLEKLKANSKDGDYVLGWWDYGYPIWFFTNRNTLIDGGKHGHDNFAIAQIMTSSSQRFVYNFSALVTERYKAYANILKDAYVSGKISKESELYKKLNYSSAVDVIFQDKQSNAKDPYDTLLALGSDDFKLPPKSVDVYLYMPYRMADIFPTIAQFGYQDLRTGKNTHDMQLFSMGAKLMQAEGKLVLDKGAVVDIKSGEIVGDSEDSLNTLSIIEARGVTTKQYNKDGNLNIIFKNNKAYIMDNEAYRSAYIQMLFLGNYDKNLFSLVVSSPYSKVYRLKR